MTDVKRTLHIAGDALAPGEQQAAFDDAAESFPQQEGRHDHAGEPQAGGDLSCSEPAAAVLSPEERHAQLDKAEALKAAGNTLYSSGDYEAAIAKYQEAVGTAPADAPQRAVFLSNMAACHLKLAQHSQAVQACSDALDIDGASVKALMRRSTAFEALDDPEQALADARRVLELDTGAPDLLAP